MSDTATELSERIDKLSTERSEARAAGDAATAERLTKALADAYEEKRVALAPNGSEPARKRVVKSALVDKRLAGDLERALSKL